MGARDREGRPRFVRFVLLAGAAAFVIYALGPRFAPASTPFRSPQERKILSDFTLTRVGGGDWRLADGRGKVLLVNFWATWCPPCRMETPELVKLYERYKDEGFEIAGISLDENPSAVPAFVLRYRIPYPVLLPGGDFDLASQIESLPTSILLDRQGGVATVYHGAVSEGDLRGDVERLLRER
jgi:thiol-disulfide isomerase/thioredoxin